MTDTNIPASILHLLLTQGPVFLACVLGLVVVILFWRKAPAASLWMAGAFALGLFTVALNAIGQLADGSTTVNLIVPVLTALTYLLLLIGAYAGRANPATTPGNHPQSLWQQLIRSVRMYPSLRNVFLNVFSFVFLLVFVLSVVRTFLLPEVYASTARVKVELGAASGSDPRSVQTEIEVIKSEVVLGQVVGDLKLNDEWGKKYGGTLKTSESMGLLKQRLEVRRVNDTSIIEIRAFSEIPNEAAKAANSVAEAYRDHVHKQTQHLDRGSLMEVEIVERAIPGMRPVRPNKPVNIGLGALTGIWLAFVAAVGVSWLAFRVGRSARPGDSLSARSEAVT